VRLFFNLLFVLILFAEKSFGDEVKKLTRFTIFSGDKKASYYAVASGICNVFNRHYSKSRFECEAIESKGSAKNLELLANGDADFAIIKSSEFNQFFIKDSKELQNKTNFIANIHDEYLTILAQKNLKIKSIADLKNKIVNIGSIGSTSALIIEKYLADFAIKPKEIVNFGAAKSFEMLCDKKIDAWIYFVGHPNSGYKQALEKCDLELVSLSAQEIDNFLKIAPFFKKSSLSKNFYSILKSDLNTISTTTILASKKHLDQRIIDLVKDILINHKDDLIKKNQIFNFLSN
jgi:TRAP transporter TAXI family solute receptor